MQGAIEKSEHPKAILDMHELLIFTATENSCDFTVDDLSNVLFDSDKY